MSEWTDEMAAAGDCVEQIGRALAAVTEVFQEFQQITRYRVYSIELMANAHEARLDCYRFIDEEYERQLEDLRARHPCRGPFAAGGVVERPVYVAGPHESWWIDSEWYRSR